MAIPPRYLDFGYFGVDLDSRVLTDPSGRAVILRRREFDLLLTFARSPGRVMDRAFLLDAIAGREADAFDRTIDVYVGRLRRKIEDDPKHPRLIVTVPGVGYRLATKPKPAELPGAAGSEPSVRASSAGARILAAFNEANVARDAGALAALYAEDAVLITPGETVSGRVAIQNCIAEHHRQFRPDPSRLEQITAIGDNIMLRGGTWWGTSETENGPVQRSCFWTTTDVYDGTSWKILTETVILTTPQRSNGIAANRARAG